MRFIVLLGTLGFTISSFACSLSGDRISIYGQNIPKLKCQTKNSRGYCNITSTEEDYINSIVLRSVPGDELLCLLSDGLDPVATTLDDPFSLPDQINTRGSVLESFILSYSTSAVLYPGSVHINSIKNGTTFKEKRALFIKAILNTLEIYANKGIEFSKIKLLAGKAYGGKTGIITHHVAITTDSILLWDLIPFYAKNGVPVNDIINIDGLGLVSPLTNAMALMCIDNGVISDFNGDKVLYPYRGITPAYQKLKRAGYINAVARLLEVGADPKQGSPYSTISNQVALAFYCPAKLEKAHLQYIADKFIIAGIVFSPEEKVALVKAGVVFSP